ncbi:MAG: hypothetical protein R2736_13900 [Solirubrobacterales bacterium]
MVDFDVAAQPYGVAMCFLPRDPARREKIEQMGLSLRSAWSEASARPLARDADRRGARGTTVNASRPHIRQFFVGAARLRRRTRTRSSASSTSSGVCELAAGLGLLRPSFSSRTVVQQGC